jgi:hypothetical protein
MKNVCMAIALCSLVGNPARAQGNAEVQVAAGQESADSFRCELTKANGRYLPDSPVPGKASAFYGNDSIAIGLGAEGRTITFQPSGAGFVLPDGSLQWKFLWMKARLPMTIEGRRLDAPSSPLRSRVNHEFDNENFQPSSLIFPTPGCWEITSRVGPSSLTFVVNVVKIGNGPDPLSAWIRMQERIRGDANVSLVDRLRLPTVPW